MTRQSARDALIDAALVEFSEHGYDATTVASIAERAGVTTGALYAHFASKLELLVSTIGLASPSEYAAMLARAYQLPLAEAVGVFDGSMALAGERRMLLLDAIVLARRDPEVAAMLRRGFEAYLAAMAVATEAGVASGALDPVLAPAELARLGAALSLGNLVLEVLDERPPARRALVGLTEAVMGSGDGAPEDLAPELARVRSRAARVARAKDRLDDAIAAAAEAGHSLRQIGDAAGVSHERVRQLLNRQDR